MKKKIYTGLFIYFLLFIGCAALVVKEAHAQSKDKDKGKQSKPTDRAKKLLAEGNKLFAKKDYRPAINKYAEAIVLSPNFAEAHYWKGYAHYYLNEFNESVDELDTAFSQGYNALDVYKIRWVVNFQKQNYDAALSDVESGLLKDKKNVDFITGRSEILVRKGQYKDAIPALEDTIKLNPDNGDLYYFLALSYGKIGDFNQQGMNAAEAIKKATKYTGESYKLIGESMVAANKPTEAIDAYKRALNVNPKMSEDFFISVTRFYRAQNLLSEAIDLARQGLKVYPQSSPLLVDLTWYYSLSDRFGEAVGAGEQAIRNAPNSAGAHTNLCRAYNDTKKYPQAIKECNEALKLNPKDGETFFYLALVNKASNKPALADDYFKKAVSSLISYTEVNQKDPDGFYLLGNSYYTIGQYKDAIESYKKSIALSPNFMKANYNLGNAYIVDENMDAAKAQYNILLKLDKNYAAKLNTNSGGKLL